MGIKSRDWSEIGEYISKIKSNGLSYKEGAKHFGISVSSIYKYNSQIKRKNQGKSSCDKAGDGVVKSFANRMGAGILF